MLRYILIKKKIVVSFLERIIAFDCIKLSVIVAFVFSNGEMFEKIETCWFRDMWLCSIGQRLCAMAIIFFKFSNWHSLKLCKWNNDYVPSCLCTVQLNQRWFSLSVILFNKHSGIFHYVKIKGENERTSKRDNSEDKNRWKSACSHVDVDEHKIHDHSQRKNQSSGHFICHRLESARSSDMILIISGLYVMTLLLSS